MTNDATDVGFGIDGRALFTRFQVTHVYRGPPEPRGKEFNVFTGR